MSSIDIQPGFMDGTHEGDWIGLPGPWWNEPITPNDPEWPDWLSRERVFP